MNPEFQRHLYLEFSFARLVGLPAFLMVVFSLTFLIDNKTLSEVTANTATGLYIAIVLFWGAKQAGESIYDELRNNTWDIQRTSAISPWSLAWGKLIGSTLYNWYGGVLCLLMFSLSTPEQGYVALTWLYSIGCGFLAQSLSLLIALFALRRKQAVNSGFNYLIALFALFFIMPVMLNIDDFTSDTINWYGVTYNQASFYLFSLILACCWTVVGIYRILVEELQIRALPTVWVLFVLFLTGYLSGFVVFNDDINRGMGIAVIEMMVGFSVCISLSYLLLFIDNNSPMQLRKLAVYFSQQQWLRVFQSLPCWFINAILALPAMLLLTLLYPVESIEDINFYPLVIFLLLMRDMGILLFFSYAANPKRAISLTLLCLISLYGLLPAIFTALNAGFLANIILPILSHTFFIAVITSAVQVGVVGFVLYKRWQNRVNIVI